MLQPYMNPAMARSRVSSDGGWRQALGYDHPLAIFPHVRGSDRLGGGGLPVGLGKPVGKVGQVRDVGTDGARAAVLCFEPCAEL